MSRKHFVSLYPGSLISFAFFILNNLQLLQLHLLRSTSECPLGLGQANTVRAYRISLSIRVPGLNSINSRTLHSLSSLVKPYMPTVYMWTCNMHIPHHTLQTVGALYIAGP